MLVLMEFRDADTISESVHPSPPLVRRAENMTNWRNCVQPRDTALFLKTYVRRDVVSEGKKPTVCTRDTQENGGKQYSNLARSSATRSNIVGAKIAA